MAPQKPVIMVLKVDLQCTTCYKKVKKLLCKYPQITGQLFDEKANTVTITVVCCSPEKMRDKLCCKAGKAIKSIDIKDEKPTKPDEKPTKGGPPTKPLPDPKPNTPPPKPPPDPKPNTPPPELGIIIIPNPVNVYPPPAHPNHSTCCGQCYQGYGGGPCEQGFGRPVPPPPHPVPVTCCGQCYQGYGGGPCQQEFGRLVPPPRGPCYDGYGYGGHKVRYMSRCEYSCEENPSGCSIM